MCITGHGGQGFLGEGIVLIPAGKQQPFWGNWAHHSRCSNQPGGFFRLSTRGLQNAFTMQNYTEPPLITPFAAASGPSNTPPNFPPSGRNNVRSSDEFHDPLFWGGFNIKKMFLLCPTTTVARKTHCETRHSGRNAKSDFTHG